MKSAKDITPGKPSQSSSTFAQMLVATVLMVICPIACYFITNSYVSSEYKTYYSVFAAVACAHVILIIMIVTALREKPNYKLD